MRDPWITFSVEIDTSYTTPRSRRRDSNVRRRALFAAGLCINGSLTPGKPGRRAGIVHGPVVPGTGKCQRCIDVAAKSRQ